MLYSKALEINNPALAYDELHRGPYEDGNLGMVVVGDYINGTRILDNIDGEFSNATSVTPWWLKVPPLDINPFAMPRLLGIIRYSDAMQTLDGEEHRAVREVVDNGLVRAAGAKTYAKLLSDLVEDEVDFVESVVQSEKVFDLRQSFRRVRLGLLAAELGLTSEIMSRVTDTTDLQMRFLWGWPQPKRSEHVDMAKSVSGMFRASQELLDENIRELEAGREPYPGIARDLARAVVMGDVSRPVAFSTLFGLINAGEGTASSTGVNIAERLISTGEWQELAEEPSKLSGRFIADMVAKHSSVLAWQKDAVTNVTLDGAQLHQTVKKDGRILVVLGAMQTDPKRPKAGHDVTFSGGIHECPGRGVTYRYLDAILGSLITRLPDIELAKRPPLSQTITFSSFSALPVRKRLP